MPANPVLTKEIIPNMLWFLALFFQLYAHFFPLGYLLLNKEIKIKESVTMEQPPTQTIVIAG